MEGYKGEKHADLSKHWIKDIISERKQPIVYILQTKKVKLKKIILPWGDTEDSVSQQGACPPPPQRVTSEFGGWATNETATFNKDQTIRGRRSLIKKEEISILKRNYYWFVSLPCCPLLCRWISFGCLLWRWGIMINQKGRYLPFFPQGWVGTWSPSSQASYCNNEIPLHGKWCIPHGVSCKRTWPIWIQ